jgi:acetolactate synthase I/II/III large subunit
VLVVGSKLAQMSTHGWRLPRSSQRVVHVDIDGEEIGRMVPAEIGIVADARAALLALSECVPTPAAPHPWFDEPDVPAPPASADADGLDPAPVVAAIDQTLGATDVVVCDASYSSGWAAAHLHITHGRNFLAPRGLAGIGWSPGAAIGAAFGAGLDRRIVVIAGDGGFAYSVAEIETAARYGLNITYVILNNSALAWINHGEQRMGIRDESTFGNVQFARVAEGFGATGARAVTIGEVEEELRRTGSGPHLIDAVTHARSAPIVSMRAATEAVTA